MDDERIMDKTWKCDSRMSIGVFDSGVGGISVLREMVRILPGEDFIFYGDSDNAPYGTKPASQIQELTLAACLKLRNAGVKALVIACNTATSAAIGLLRKTFSDIPVVGIEPALKPAVHLKKSPKVLVLATPGTVAGKKYRLLQEQFESEADVISLGCPGLMEFVERGELHSPALDAYLEDLLSPYRGKVDDVVLGCTHYPFVRDSIGKVLGEGVPILDGSEGTARQLKNRLEETGLLRDRENGGTVRFEGGVSGKEDLCRRLLAMEERP